MMEAPDPISKSAPKIGWLAERVETVERVRVQAGSVSDPSQATESETYREIPNLRDPHRDTRRDRRFAILGHSAL